ncbi:MULTISPECIES: nuclear transport factor 2 family protein [unclassified Novosphingobium]|uniref:nuclear transport factor 2 family protein n=1 Tax=unclassified Novosphingobium TaxID=2644732 RepID=UPI00135ABB7C|nr:MULTISPECIES: nuclear transport factor 2 family protein [unclassified Novosphingobium]
MDVGTEIRDLAARRDRKLQLSAFHDDADVDCDLLRGWRAEFTDFAQGFPGNMLGSQHLIGQVDINIEGDHGSGEVYFFAFHRVSEDGEQYDLFMAGRYIDEYALQDARWAILKRREIIDWARKDKSSDDFISKMPLLHLAGRRGADFSETRDWTDGSRT